MKKLTGFFAIITLVLASCSSVATTSINSTDSTKTATHVDTTSVTTHSAVATHIVVAVDSAKKTK